MCGFDEGGFGAVVEDIRDSLLVGAGFGFFESRGYGFSVQVQQHVFTAEGVD